MSFFLKVFQMFYFMLINSHANVQQIDIYLNCFATETFSCLNNNTRSLPPCNILYSAFTLALYNDVKQHLVLELLTINWQMFQID